MYSPSNSAGPSRETRPENSRRKTQRGVTSGQKYRDRTSPGSSQQYSPDTMWNPPVSPEQLAKSYNTMLMQFIVQRHMYHRACKAMQQETQSWNSCIYHPGQMHHVACPVANYHKYMQEGPHFANHEQLMRGPLQQTHGNWFVPSGHPFNNLQRDDSRFLNTPNPQHFSQNPASYWNPLYPGQSLVPGMMRLVQDFMIAPQPAFIRFQGAMTGTNHGKHWHNPSHRGGGYRDQKPPRFRRKQRLQHHENDTSLEQDSCNEEASINKQPQTEEPWKGSSKADPSQTELNEEASFSGSLQCCNNEINEKTGLVETDTTDSVASKVTMQEEEPHEKEAQEELDCSFESTETLCSSNTSEMDGPIDQRYRNCNWSVPAGNFSSDSMNWQTYMHHCLNTRHTESTHDYNVESGGVAHNWEGFVSKSSNFSEDRGNYQTPQDNNPLRGCQEWTIPHEMFCNNPTQTWEDVHDLSNDFINFHHHQEVSEKTETEYSSCDKADKIADNYTNKQWNEPSETFSMEDIQISCEQEKNLCVDDESQQNKCSDNTPGKDNPARTMADLKIPCDLANPHLDDSLFIPFSDSCQLNEIAADIQKEQDEIVESLRKQDHIHEQLMKFYRYINEQESGDYNPLEILQNRSRNNGPQKVCIILGK